MRGVSPTVNRMRKEENMSVRDQITRIKDTVALQNNAIDAARTLLATKTTEVEPPVERNVRKWVYNNAADSAAGVNFTITENDEWLRANRNDSSLTIVLAPLFTVGSIASAIVIYISSNRYVTGTNYGRVVRNSSSGSLSSSYVTRPINDSTAVATFPGFKVDADGTLTFTCRDGGGQVVLPAGKWLITAAIEGGDST